MFVTVLLPSRDDLEGLNRPEIFSDWWRISFPVVTSTKATRFPNGGRWGNPSGTCIRDMLNMGEFHEEIHASGTSGEAHCQSEELDSSPLSGSPTLGDRRHGLG
jgi:hypothetical protein